MLPVPANSCAELIRPRCEKPCGKLPTSRLRTASYSSARRPSGVRSDSSRSNNLDGGVAPSAEHVGVDEPEAAGEEGAFVAAHAVVDVVGGVALDETVAQQVFFDGLDRPDDARVVRRQEAGPGISSRLASSVLPP